MQRSGGQARLKGRFYGAILRVASLEDCRRFYRDAVGLGPPVVDSNFWVEFECPSTGMIIALEQNPAAQAAAAVACGSVGVCLETKTLSTFEKRLAEHGVHPQRKARLPSGRQALFFLDPENNPFVVIQATPTAGKESEAEQDSASGS